MGKEGRGRMMRILKSMLALSIFLSSTREGVSSALTYTHNPIMTVPCEKSQEKKFHKKVLINCLALAGLSYHLWQYKLKPVQAAICALSYVCMGSDFSTDQKEDIAILSSIIACSSALLVLHGLLNFDDGSQSKAADEIQRLLAQAPTGSITKETALKNLVEAVYALDIKEVKKELIPLSVESKDRLLRIIESISFQELYKKERIKKQSLLELCLGSIGALISLGYLHQEN